MGSPPGEQCLHLPTQRPPSQGLRPRRRIFSSPGSGRWVSTARAGGFILTKGPHPCPIPPARVQVLPQAPPPQSACLPRPRWAPRAPDPWGCPAKVTRPGCGHPFAGPQRPGEGTPPGYVSVPAAGTWPPGCPRSRGRRGSEWRAPGTPPPCRACRGGAGPGGVSVSAARWRCAPLGSDHAPALLRYRPARRRRSAWATGRLPLTSARLGTRGSGAAPGREGGGAEVGHPCGARPPRPCRGTGKMQTAPPARAAQPRHSALLARGRPPSKTRRALSVLPRRALQRRPAFILRFLAPFIHSTEVRPLALRHASNPHFPAPLKYEAVRQGLPRRKHTGAATREWARAGVPAEGRPGWELPGEPSLGPRGAQCRVPTPGPEGPGTPARSMAPAATAQTSARTHEPRDRPAGPRIQAHLVHRCAPA